MQSGESFKLYRDDVVKSKIIGVLNVGPLFPQLLRWEFFLHFTMHSCYFALVSVPHSCEMKIDRGNWVRVLCGVTLRTKCGHWGEQHGQLSEAAGMLARAN